MRKHFIIILSILAVVQIEKVFGQRNVNISGTVKDSVSKMPIGFATITLVSNNSDSSSRKTLADESGHFLFSNINTNTSYSLKITAVGYTSTKMQLPSIISAASKDIFAGEVLLHPIANQLHEVVVNTASRNPVRQEADRITYDLSADPESNALSLLDMLRKVPLITIDAGDKILLKGSSEFKILINGKPSALVVKNPSDLFKSIPASTIQKIEVITIPPAKYDAEGLVGILNIITRKKEGQGYNGSISTAYNSVLGPSINFNGTAKQGKWGISGYLGYSDVISETTGYGYNNLIFNVPGALSPRGSGTIGSGGTLIFLSDLVQQGNKSFKGANQYGSADISYDVDSLNLITLSLQYYGGNFVQGNYLLSNEVDQNNNLLQSYILNNNGGSAYTNSDLSFNLQHGFRGNKEKLFTASYKYSIQDYGQRTDAAYNQTFNYDYPNNKQYDNSGTAEHTIQLDYVFPLRHLSVESGLKAIVRNNFSGFSTDNLNSISGQYIPDTSMSNNFNYHQNVFSAYNTYKWTYNSLQVNAGLRLEHTSNNTAAISGINGVNNAYNNLIPSFSLLKTFSNSNSLSIGFTNRILRPAIWQLNPFTDKSNPLEVSKGNPALQPIIRHSFEMNYTYSSKGTITAGLSYGFSNNSIEHVSSITNDTVTLITYQNIGSNKSAGFTLNTSYPFFKDLTVNLNALSNYVWLAGYYNGTQYRNQGLQGHISFSAGYNFKGGYHAGADLQYETRYILLQGKDNNYYYLSISGSKEILKKKAVLSFYISNPFTRFRKMDYLTNTTDFNLYNYDNIYSRRINISFRYKFGKLKGMISSSQHSIQNDDIGEKSNH